MAKKDEDFEVTGKLKHETLKAALVDVGEEAPLWFPKSQCSIEVVGMEGDDEIVSIIMEQWLAEAKGIV